MLLVSPLKISKYENKQFLNNSIACMFLNQECDKYRKESEEALHRMEALQQDLNTINADLCKSNREKDVSEILSRFISHMTFW